MGIFNWCHPAWQGEALQLVTLQAFHIACPPQQGHTEYHYHNYSRKLWQGFKLGDLVNLGQNTIYNLFCCISILNRVKNHQIKTHQLCFF